jgi:hydrogenase nickel incorporation protein HypA/HybF
MHEMSLAQGILEIVEEAARAREARSVTSVCLELGALSGVEPEAIAFCFDAVARGTVAEGARLVIEAVPGRAWCLACNRSVPLARRDDPCPLCAGYQMQMTDGARMRVRELEIET